MIELFTARVSEGVCSYLPWPPVPPPPMWPPENVPLDTPVPCVADKPEEVPLAPCIELYDVPLPPAKTDGRYDENVGMP